MKFTLPRFCTILALFTIMSTGAFAQSGASFSGGLTMINQDFLDSTNGQFSGWNIRLAAKLGSRVWFFAPELNYINTNVNPQDSNKPFAKVPRIHTLKIPVGLGLKFKTTPFQKILFKGGIIGSYVLAIDPNDKVGFDELADEYAGYYGAVGYEIRWVSVEYRYEKSLIDNYFDIEDSKFSYHSLTLGVNF